MQIQICEPSDGVEIIYSNGKSRCATLTDIQFISEKYSGLIDWSMDQINCYVLDIETATEQSGFPDADQANEEILLITLKNQ